MRAEAIRTGVASGSRSVLGVSVSPVVPTLLGAACISSSAIVSRLADTAPGTTSF